MKKTENLESGFSSSSAEAEINPNGSIGERIREVRNGMSQDEFAKAFGVHPNTLKRYESGERTPDADFLRHICSYYQTLNPSWFLLGEGTKVRPEIVYTASDDDFDAWCRAASERELEWYCEWRDRINNAPRKASDDGVGIEFSLVPQYAIEAAAGAGKVVERESEVGKLAFRRDWIRQKGLVAKDLVVIRVVGDSMTPTIRDGSLVLVDTRQEQARSDGIYVMMVDDHLVAKRLQVDLAGGGLYIRSDNPAYREQYLTAEQAGNLFIIGRVVWAGGEV